MVLLNPAARNSFMQHQGVTHQRREFIHSHFRAHTTKYHNQTKTLFKYFSLLLVPLAFLSKKWFQYTLWCVSVFLHEIMTTITYFERNLNLYILYHSPWRLSVPSEKVIAFNNKRFWLSDNILMVSLKFQDELFRKKKKQVVN